MRRIFILAMVAVFLTQTAFAMPVKPVKGGSFDIELGYVGTTGVAFDFGVNSTMKPGFDAAITLGSTDGFGVVGSCGSMQTSLTGAGGNASANFSFSDFAIDAVWTNDEIIGGGLSYGGGILARALPIYWKTFSGQTVDAATTTNFVGLEVLGGYNGRKPDELIGLYAGIDVGYGYSFTQGPISANTWAMTYDAEAGVTIGLGSNWELSGGGLLKGMNFDSDHDANFTLYGFRAGVGYRM